jgi:hypothetical protein
MGRGQRKRRGTRRGSSSRRSTRSGSGRGGAVIVLVLAAAAAVAFFLYRGNGADEVPATARTAYHDAIGQGICRDILNTYECAAAIEQRVLPALADHAARRGDTLVLRLAGPDSVVLTSAPPGEEIDAPGYHLVGMLESGHFVVHGQWYEGDFYLLVNRASGEEQAIWARPVVSPEGERILVASADLDAGYNPNGFQIWRVAGSRVSLEWSFEPDTWAPVSAEWADEGSVRFAREAWCENRSGICRTPALLEQRAGRWAVRDTGPTRAVTED